MKVTRRQLKNIIKEFLDTSAKPTTQATSTYDQATNSERAAFISAMGIAEKASKKGKVDALQEGTVYSFPGAFGPATKPETQTDLDGDLTPEELAVYGLGKDPYDDEYDIEDEVEDQADAYVAAFDKRNYKYLPPELEDLEGSVSLPAGEVLPFSRKRR